MHETLTANPYYKDCTNVTGSKNMSTACEHHVASDMLPSNLQTGKLGVGGVCKSASIKTIRGCSRGVFPARA